jgi:2-dehydro-3-deoxygluconokinase
MYFVSHDAQGHHFSYARAGSAASRMQPSDVHTWQGAIGASRWLHLSGISLAISASACDTALAAMQAARASGTQVSLDSNLRLSLWPLARAQACITHAIGLCDLFLPSLEDITALTGLTEPNAILDWCHAHGAQQVVLKLGAEGAVASEGTRRQRLSGWAVQAVDATGAGDCFAGNLLARLSQGDDLWTATAYANAAASLSVQGYGAVAPLPLPGAVLNRLNA